MRMLNNKEVDPPLLAKPLRVCHPAPTLRNRNKKRLTFVFSLFFGASMCLFTLVHCDLVATEQSV